MAQLPAQQPPPPPPNPPFRILLIGKGGREHALAWKLAQSPLVEHVYVVPGNGGTAAHGMMTRVSNVEDVKEGDYEALVERAKSLGVGLVVAGTDASVVGGVGDVCREAGIPCFAPTAAAAQIEGSKAWAKDFMKKHNIPTAEYKTFTDPDAAANHGEAKNYLLTAQYPIVIKASGLAAGKGVVIAQTLPEAEKALSEIMLDLAHGEAGKEVVIEEFLEGDEISILTFSDGMTMKSLPSSQDHKAIWDGDKGPNTGGMGVIAPTPRCTGEVMERIRKEVLEPTFEGMREEGYPFTGLLFTGLILTRSGPKVLEYNARFGDPETQSVLLLLHDDTDLAEILLACTQQRLEEVEVKTKTGFACNVVLVAGGYPGKYPTGKPIEVGKLPEGAVLFHAGTALKDNQLVTAGGRVVSVAATGETAREAVEAAYEGVEAVRFEGMFCRRDIGRKFL